MNSLKKNTSTLSSLGMFMVLAGGADAAPTDLLPLPHADAATVARKCAPLVDVQVARWGDVNRWEILSIWPSTAESPEAKPSATYRTEHYCARMRLVRADQSIERTSFLCTVANRGSPAEVWSFGNNALASSICELTNEGAALVDGNAPLIARDITRPPAPAATNQPISPATVK